MSKRVITQAHLIEFEAYLQTEEKRKLTIQKYLRDLTTFCVYCSGREVNKDIVIAYKSYLGNRYMPASANSMLASLNSFLHFAGWQEFCVKQFKVQKKAFIPAERELTRIEYSRLIRAAEQKKNERLALVLQTICCTGMRVSELAFVTVEAAESGEVTVSCKNKIRSIILVKALRRKLLNYARERAIKSGCIFTTRSGTPLNRSNIWREMKALCRSAGVSKEKVFPHNLRHLFARIFYEMEKDIAKLADVLGHSSINTTRIYIMTTGEEHRRQMERMRLIM